jgi:lipoate-protein ligase B
VYTLGRSADGSNILASEEELREAGIDVVQTNRGGDVTFHGPGQLVGYPIIDLASRKKGALWYVNGLEDVLIGVLHDYGIEGSRSSVNRGVWVGDSKIAAIGVRITRQITMHGFALNVRTDLQYYQGIVPCGLSGKGVLSMHLLNPKVTLDDVKQRVLRHFIEEFGYPEISSDAE